MTKKFQQFKQAVIIICITFTCFYAPSVSSQHSTQTINIGIVGLSHAHVHWILGRPDHGDIKIVGIVEPNRELAQRLSDHYGFSMELVFDSMTAMISATNPDAVTAFGSIFEHLKVVETCAPLGIHIMVEKPLAVSVAHAKKMKALAKKHRVHLVTNYETTWYASNHKAYEMVHQGAIGEMRKVVIHDGHKGPAEIGINKEFLDWLTDPVANGAGALTDFGCYGANLITWLHKGAKPISVMAVTQTIKPELYPHVDDEATIILKYPKMQTIIQASWNWPISRKDMEIYGKTGYVFSENSSDIRYRLSENDPEQREKLPARTMPYNDPFSMFAALINDEITLSPYGLSTLENNMIVVEILEAAKKSAQTGTVVYLKK